MNNSSRNQGKSNIKGKKKTYVKLYLETRNIELIKEIESTKKFPANKSVLCDWCEYKSMCPEFDKIQKEKELDIWN